MFSFFARHLPRAVLQSTHTPDDRSQTMSPLEDATLNTMGIIDAQNDEPKGRE